MTHFNRTALFFVALGFAPTTFMPRASAQTVEQGVAIVSETIASRVDGFNYGPDSSSELEFVGSALSARATGEAEIRVNRDKTEIDAKFQRLPDPSSLGPFAVYVLWVVTPEGRAINVGLLNVDGEKARIKTTTPLSSFALIVTAEPHFAVSIPSKDIVLQNVGKNVKGTKIAVTSLAAREDYSSLKPAAQDPKHPIPVELQMARYAFEIAAAAGAKELASIAYERSKQSLASAEAALVSKKHADRDRVGEFAREAIQAGEDARAGAEARRTVSESVGKSKEIAAKDADLAQLQQELAASRKREIETEKLVPNQASRLSLASELLSRWFTIPPQSESGLTMHVAEEMFVKSRAELVPDMQERLALATGVLLGIGKLSVSVTPSVQAGNDMQKLQLSQQRARAVMEWFAAMGVKAVLGTTTGDAEASLAIGPGVDLLIEAASGDLSEPDKAKKAEL